jgi:hypothetical protein
MNPVTPNSIQTERVTLCMFVVNMRHLLKNKKQEGHNDPELLTRNNCFTVFEIIFQINMRKGKSSSTST